MRPPSYYASLSNYNYTPTSGGSYHSGSYNSNSNSNSNSNYNSSHGSSSLSHLNRSSHQLRSSLSSPSSSSYVTRSHLPFVSQSMLVAHCFTGVGSSTKPNYGHHQSAYSSAAGSSSATSYSTSYSRPKSMKRYEPATTASGSVGSSYLSSSKSYSSPSTTRLNYLSGSSASSTYQRPPTSSYYPKPIRLRERPLLTQISRQFDSTAPKPRPAFSTSTSSAASASYKPVSSTTSVQSDGNSIHSKSPALEDTGIRKKEGEDISKDKLNSTQQQQQQQEEEEENWSSDVARNISRNKYLIKFREFEKRPSVPIQLTNGVEQEQQSSNSITTSELLGNRTTAEPKDLSVRAELRASVEELPAQQRSKKEEDHQVSSDPPMKVPPAGDARGTSTEKASPPGDGPLRKVGSEAKPSKAELAPSSDDNNHDNGSQKTQDQPQQQQPAAKIVDEEKGRRVPKEKRNIKLKIRTMGSSGSAAPMESTSDNGPQPQEETSPPKTRTSIDRGGEPLEKLNCKRETLSSANSSDSPQVTATKPKVKRLVKTSSKRAIKTPPSSSEVKAAADTAITFNTEPLKATPPSPDKVIPLTPDKVSNKIAKTKQPAPGKSEKQKSAGSKVELDNNSGQRKVLAPKQVEQNVCENIKHEPETSSKQQQILKNNSEQVRKPEEVDTRMVVQENKRIRFREYHLADFNFLSVLGHGGWGFVILAELKQHDACFAVKCIKKITIVEDDDFDSIMIERKVLTLGNIHPFICKLFCTFETEGYLFFVMEYCPGGDLMFHVQKDGKFTESRCRFYAAEIICAIRFLHNRHIIYRDLKLDNILLDSRGHIRLVDFGMCQCRTYREEMLPSNFCGTPEYISPEIIKGVPYNHSVDWWSFGVLLYEMAVGKMPFRGNDENELLWNVCYEQIHYPMFLTKELTLLLQSLLEREPTKRMGMATCKAGDIYDQAWFRGVDWAAIEELRVPPPFIPEVNSKRDVQNFDADFTESRAELSPVDESTLQKIDQTQFQKFPYTNPDIFIFDSLCL